MSRDPSSPVPGFLPSAIEPWSSKMARRWRPLRERPTAAMDLNADVGEWSGSEPDGEGHLIEVMTTVHVACGFHAGSPDVMRRTVAVAAASGVVVGAHPSYPDRQGFGRRPMN